jgi:hypothetical protein
VGCVLRLYFGQNARDLGVPVDNDLLLGSGSALVAKGRSGNDGSGTRRRMGTKYCTPSILLSAVLWRW